MKLACLTFPKILNHIFSLLDEKVAPELGTASASLIRTTLIHSSVVVGEVAVLLLPMTATLTFPPPRNYYRRVRRGPPPSPRSCCSTAASEEESASEASSASPLASAPPEEYSLEDEEETKECFSVQTEFTNGTDAFNDDSSNTSSVGLSNWESFFVTLLSVDYLGVCTDSPYELEDEKEQKEEADESKSGDAMEEKEEKKNEEKEKKAEENLQVDNQEDDQQDDDETAFASLASNNDFAGLWKHFPKVMAGIASGKNNDHDRIVISSIGTSHKKSRDEDDEPWDFQTDNEGDQDEKNHVRSNCVFEKGKADDKSVDTIQAFYRMLEDDGISSMAPSISRSTARSTNWSIARSTSRSLARSLARSSPNVSKRWEPIDHGDDDATSVASFVSALTGDDLSAFTDFEDDAFVPHYGQMPLFPTIMEYPSDEERSQIDTEEDSITEKMDEKSTGDENMCSMDTVLDAWDLPPSNSILKHGKSHPNLLSTAKSYLPAPPADLLPELLIPSEQTFEKVRSFVDI